MTITVHPRDEDDELMRRLAAGEPAVLETLYTRHYRLVHGHAADFLRDQALAEDALQEVFLKVLEQAASYRPAGKFRAWLLTLCYNHCRNVLRYRQRQPHSSADPEGERATPPSSAPDPAHGVQVRDDLAWVMRRLAELPPDTRAALLMQGRDGLSVADIARVLAWSEAKVKTTLHRTRAHLARCRQQECLP